MTKKKFKKNHKNPDRESNRIFLRNLFIIIIIIINLPNFLRNTYVKQKKYDVSLYLTVQGFVFFYWWQPKLMHSIDQGRQTF
jgi:hypothetical protein